MHNVIHIPLASDRRGRTHRTFRFKRGMVVQGLRKEYKNGTPVTMRDIVSVPVKRRGEWNMRDMLNLRSVEALWVAYNRAEGKVA